MAVGDAGHEQSETDRGRGRRQGGQRRHPLEAVARALAVHGDEVVESPGAVEAEVLAEAHPFDDLAELHPLLGHVDPESHGPDHIGSHTVSGPRGQTARRHGCRTDWSGLVLGSPR